MIDNHRNEMRAIYFQVTDLWKRLCEQHALLFDLTCDEYTFLLESNLDGLEAKIAEKQHTIENIGLLEGQRQEVVAQLNSALNNIGHSEYVSNVKDLLAHMRQFEDGEGKDHLFRFNALLIDMIEKIQEQNKRNRLFIVKALDSLREIRERAMGAKSHTVYTSLGRTSTRTVRVD